MGNALKNAGFVDTHTDWAQTGSATLAVDETTRGAPGRAVLTLSRTASGSGQAATAYGLAGAVTAGDPIEAFGLYGASGAAAELAVAIYSGGGSLLSRTVVPQMRAAQGTARRGVASTMAYGYLLTTAAATGTARLELKTTSAAAGATVGWLAKPYLDKAYVARPYPVFDPGAHTNVDLQLPVWPSSLPPISDEGYSATPTDVAGEFATDSGVPIYPRRTGAPWWMVRGQMLCDPLQQDALDTFFRDARKFWFVRPDTGDLCIARWTKDGTPRPARQVPGKAYVAVGLLLQVA